MKNQCLVFLALVLPLSLYRIQRDTPAGPAARHLDTTIRLQHTIHLSLRLTVGMAVMADIAALLFPAGAADRFCSFFLRKYPPKTSWLSS